MNNFHKYLDSYNIPVEMFINNEYDEGTYNNIIRVDPRQMLESFDKLLKQNISKNKIQTQDHFFFDFINMKFQKKISIQMNHNIMPFVIHYQSDGLYLETWSSAAFVEQIYSMLGVSKYLFFPVLLENNTHEDLHVSLLILDLNKFNYYYWDSNGKYSCFYDPDSYIGDSIGYVLNSCLDNILNSPKMKENGLSFTYKDLDNFIGYCFNIPKNKKYFDKGNCLVHTYLTPYLIKKANSIEKIEKLFKNLDPNYQKDLIYNFSANLYQKYIMI